LPHPRNTPMRSVLVGIDDSNYSRAAVELAIRWATGRKLLVLGLGIVDIPDLTAAEPVPLGAAAYKSHRDATAIVQAREKVEHLLQQFSLRCAAAKVASRIVEREGGPAEQIAREAHRVDLIVLGQRTNFDLTGEALMTEVLPDVIKHCPRPVVIVPALLPESTGVVVAYDGSLQSARALQMFQQSGLGQGHAVHVVSIDADRGKAARIADVAVEFLQSHDIQASPHPIVSTSPAATILEQVQTLKAGLLIVGAYGKPALREFFFGSTTRTFLAQSPVPTFLYA
jgi:nucleotide-binding universal stress UspA family protein